MHGIILKIFPIVGMDNEINYSGRTRFTKMIKMGEI